MNDTTDIDKYQSLFDKSRKLIDELWTKSKNGHFFYSQEHIEDILSAIEKIGKKSDLEEPQILLSKTTALFLIGGFISNTHRPRKEGVKRMLNYFEDWGIEKELVEQIMSIGQNNEEDTRFQVIYDAFNAHKGKKGLNSKMEMLKLERERSKGDDYFRHDWEKVVYRYLKYTSFKTSYAKEKYHERWTKNIRKQADQMQSAFKATTRKKTGKEFGRGIDTLYRTSYNNHINLSSIADGKANMMISINTIILSVIITLSGASLTLSKTFIIEHWRFVAPIFILLVGCMFSVIFAVVSARPRITHKVVNKERIDSGKSSVLFFGNFLKLGRKEFTNQLSKLKHDQEKLYNNMSTDLYYLGAVLESKYKMLSTSYTIFVVGLVLSVMTFVLTFFYTIFFSESFYR